MCCSITVRVRCMIWTNLYVWGRPEKNKIEDLDKINENCRMSKSQGNECVFSIVII